MNFQQLRIIREAVQRNFNLNTFLSSIEVYYRFMNGLASAIQVPNEFRNSTKIFKSVTLTITFIC